MIRESRTMRAVFILASAAVCFWWYSGKSNGNTTEASSPQGAAEVAMTTVLNGVTEWMDATGTALGAPHGDASFAGGERMWGASKVVKYKGSNLCVLAGSLDGKPPRISVADDDAPCSETGVAELQQFICESEGLSPCPAAKP